MDTNKVLVNLFCIILSIRFSLEVEFVSDNIILIFSQSSVNIMIETKIHPIVLCIFQMKQNRLTVVMERIIKRI